MTKDKTIHPIAFFFLTICYPMFVIGLMVDSLKMFAACGGVCVYLYFTVLMSYELGSRRESKNAKCYSRLT